MMACRDSGGGHMLYIYLKYLIELYFEYSNIKIFSLVLILADLLKIAHIRKHINNIYSINIKNDFFI